MDGNAIQNARRVRAAEYFTLVGQVTARRRSPPHGSR